MKNLLAKLIDKMKDKPKISLFAFLGLMFVIGFYFKINFILISATTIIFLIQFFYYTRDALKNLFDCLIYLLFVAPVAGCFAAIYSLEYNLIKEEWLSVVVMICTYFFIWLLIVLFGEIKTVKLATLIIAQGATVIYLISSMVINFIPVSEITSLYPSLSIGDLAFIQTHFEISIKGILKICIEIMIYPSLITALITYLLAEVREYNTQNQLS